VTRPVRTRSWIVAGFHLAHHAASTLPIMPVDILASAAAAAPLA
jgi:hypothetical protein